MENTLIKKLPPMLTGIELEEALAIQPDYDPNIIDMDAATRLVSLSDIYKVFVPTNMSKEIYTRMYLSLLRSLQKKESKVAIQQYPYISTKKRPQTSTLKKKKQAIIPEVIPEIPAEEISISTLVQRAKNESRDIVPFLQSYITVEVVKI